MLKIGDFSRLAQVSVRTLRLYDELGLLHPAAVDDFTGYRYYDLAQLPQLHRILALKDLGLSLDQIAATLAQHSSTATLRELFQTRQAELQRELSETQSRLQHVTVRLALLDQATDPAIIPDIVVRPIPPLIIAGIRRTIPHLADIGAAGDRDFAILAEWAATAQRPATDTNLVLYHMDDYRETDLDLEYARLLEPPPTTTLPPHPEIRVRTLPAVPTAAVWVLATTFQQLSFRAIDLLHWAATHHYEPASAMRELHRFGDSRTVASDAPIILELQLPLAPATR